MRQLGGRLPQPPPMRTDTPVRIDLPVTTDEDRLSAAEPQVQQPKGWLEAHEAQQPDPYPVEVHRIERQPIAAVSTEAAPSPVSPPEPAPVEVAAESAAIAPEGISMPTVACADEPAAESISRTLLPLPTHARRGAQAADAPAPPPKPRNAHPEPVPLRITEAEPAEPKLPGGRWGEFGELRRLEPGRGSRVSLEPIPSTMVLPPASSRGLLAADREPERRSSFLTFAVTGMAAILAIGALVWSGSLRDRLRQQDVEMSALQEQNRKLADMLTKMHQDEKTSGVLSPEPASTTAPVDTTSPDTSTNSTQLAANSSPPKTETATPPAQADNSPAPAPKQPAQPTAANREGISNPPPVRGSNQRRGSHSTEDPNYHPEIVPPYPTISKQQSMATAVASNQPAPQRRTYRQPFTRDSSGAPAASSTGASQHSPTPAPSTRSQSSGTSQSGHVMAPAIQSSTPAYSATSSGIYASALAQNIEAVESLQRQSTVPLREFHARAGAPAKVLPGVTVSVQSPDAARGSYGLVVNGGGTSYQLHGHVNSPLAFTDNVTHQVYELVILQIAGGEAYGYVRSAQQ
jgi:hypothetical protein